MAARHAGFAVVSSITEGLVNSLIETAFANHAAPLAHTLPTPISVAAGPSPSPAISPSSRPP